jgi:hypothetical protein
VQCGFTAASSTFDMVFSVKHLQEKYWAQRQPLNLTFINLNMAFDLISRKGLFALRIGCIFKLVSMITLFY